MAKKYNALRKHERTGSLVNRSVQGLAAIPAAAAATWILYSHLAIDHHVVLPEALPGERLNFQSRRAGQISYYRSQEANSRPLVLLHSINAAASAYEMKPLFRHYQNKRLVFAPDLPGFGFSERAKQIYSPVLYRDSILEFLANVVGEPADVVALSLSGEFAAQAALLEPERFASLVLISPSGFTQSTGDRLSQQAGRSGVSNVIHPFFSLPVWARPFYDLLTTKTIIEYFLKKSFIGQVPSDLIEYDYASAHQPGAEHAPLYFISGKLFSPDIRRSVYDYLKIPSLVLYDRDGFTNFDMLPETLANNHYWQAVRLVPSLGLPHFELLGSTVRVLDQFWH